MNKMIGKARKRAERKEETKRRRSNKKM